MCSHPKPQICYPNTIFSLFYLDSYNYRVTLRTNVPGGPFSLPPECSTFSAAPTRVGHWQSYPELCFTNHTDSNLFLRSNSFIPHYFVQHRVPSSLFWFHLSYCWVLDGCMWIVSSVLCVHPFYQMLRLLLKKKHAMLFKFKYLLLLNCHWIELHQLMECSATRGETCVLICVYTFISVLQCLT